MLTATTMTAASRTWSTPKELVFEELVGDEPLRQDDHEVELLAGAEPGRVGVVFVVQVFLRSEISRYVCFPPEFESLYL
jgi:hypothetical protein